MVSASKSKPPLNYEKLLNLSVQIMALSELITAAEGEITPEFEAHMHALSKEHKGTTDVYGFLLQRLAAESNFMRAEARKYADKARRAEAAIEKLSARIKTSMSAMHTTLLKGDRWGFQLKKSRPKASIQEEAFPNVKDRPDLWRVKTEYAIDKAAVLERLQAGEKIPGAELETVYALTPIDIVQTIEVVRSRAKALKGKSND